MTSTIVRDSIVGDQWIQQACEAVPVQRVVDQETGQVTEDILTGPVRLAFDTLFELPQPTPTMQNPKYGAALLFTPLADFSLFHEDYNAVCAAEFADHYDADSRQYLGLHSPFRDQGEKAKFGGFTPGCVFITSTSKFKPPVVDAQGNPVVDPSKVYPGVWAICSVSKYSYKDPRKKGVGFGLQNVMLIGDDTKFGGGAPDPRKTFGAVQGAITPPVVQGGAVQAAAGAAGAPPVNPAMPGAPAGGTYAAPPAGANPNAGTAPGNPALTPATTGAPNGGAQYTMPGQAPAAAPVAAGDPRGPIPHGFMSWAEYDDLMG